MRKGIKRKSRKILQQEHSASQVPVRRGREEQEEERGIVATLSQASDEELKPMQYTSCKKQKQRSVPEKSSYLHLKDLISPVYRRTNERGRNKELLRQAS